MAVRTVMMERDPQTRAQSVMDIREFDEPAPCSNRSWTGLGRDADDARRALLLSLSTQIDDLLAGRVDEIVVTAVR